MTDNQLEKIKTYFEKQPDVEVVYLFGSRAKGKTKTLSDYDFAVLFNKSTSKSRRFDLKLEFIMFFSNLFKTDKVDVLDLNSAPVAFCYEATAPRMDIFTRSKKVRDEFEHKTMQEFLDRIYYIKRHTQKGLKLFAEKGLE